MRTFVRCFAVFLLAVLLQAGVSLLLAQSVANSGVIAGTVTDPSGAVVPGATVSINNPVSQYSRKAVTDSTGHYQIPNVPFNPYHLSVNVNGFNPAAEDVDVRSTVIVTANISLTVGAASSTVTVEGGEDLLENDPTFHTDVDRSLFSKVPLESQSSSLSSLVTLASPGVAADSNGLFHGLGDHASNSFSVDGQPITDQQSKVFSNQLPLNSIQSMEVISGAPPAEYGGKTSLVIEVTTRSGQGLTKPTGSITTSYGTFGSATAGFDLGYGGKNWGNFIEADGLNTGRFLDPPEFIVFHDKGNEQNVFDRVDYQITPVDAVHLSMNYSRSWFQTPNSYDNLNVLDQFGNNVGNTDQRSKIETFNIAPTYTRVLSSNAVFNFGPYIRKDFYHYFPSDNPLADLGPPNLQNQTISQFRTLTNAGVHSDVSYTKGINTAKAGIVYSQTFLRENDNLSIVAPTFNSPCLDANLNPVNGFTDPSQCAAAGLIPNDGSNPNATATPFNPVLLPYDLTRGGGYFNFFGHTDIKELALYVEDQIKAGNWLFNLGIRGDLYNGLTKANQAEPRVGIAYNIKPSNTILRVSYARTLESPFNENLVLSSVGCTSPVLSPLLLCTPGVSGNLAPGYRNEFHAGFQQAIGHYAVISGEYIWKYTHNAFDFSVLGNTPITFPIDWHNSKIPGYAIRGDVPTIHNFSGYVVMSSVAARFFPPQVAGAGATVGQSGFPFRIDHDEKFNQTTHIQYQIKTHGPWLGFNWRYDSGLTAASTPCFNINDPNSICNPVNGGPSFIMPNGQPGIHLNQLTFDQQFEAGLTCDGVRATRTSGFASCDAAGLTSKLVTIPAPGTEDDDKNPQRIASRHLFDAVVGQENIFRGDRYRWNAQVSALNLTNQYSLYNFLSTFSGTHYVSPRTVSGQISFNF